MRCVLCYPSTYEKLPFNRLSGWKPFSRKATATYGPKVVRGTLYVEDEVPRDTYFDFGCSPECVEWLHGNLFVNGFNIGRYHTAGPQKTLYIPGPFLKQGDNEVRVILATMKFVTTLVVLVAKFSCIPTMTPYYMIPLDSMKTIANLLVLSCDIQLTDIQCLKP